MPSPTNSRLPSHLSSPSLIVAGKTQHHRRQCCDAAGATAVTVQLKPPASSVSLARFHAVTSSHRPSPSHSLLALSAAVHCCSKHRRGLGLPPPPRSRSLPPSPPHSLHITSIPSPPTKHSGFSAVAGIHSRRCSDLLGATPPLPSIVVADHSALPLLSGRCSAASVSPFSSLFGRGTPPPLIV